MPKQTLHHCFQKAPHYFKINTSLSSHYSTQFFSLKNSLSKYIHTKITIKYTSPYLPAVHCALTQVFWCTHRAHLFFLPWRRAFLNSSWTLRRSSRSSFNCRGLHLSSGKLNPGRTGQTLLQITHVPRS